MFPSFRPTCTTVIRVETFSLKDTHRHPQTHTDTHRHTQTHIRHTSDTHQTHIRHTSDTHIRHTHQTHAHIRHTHQTHISYTYQTCTSDMHIRRTSDARHRKCACACPLSVCSRSGTENVHKITPVTKGVRHALTIAFTCDPSKVRYTRFNAHTYTLTKLCTHTPTHTHTAQTTNTHIRTWHTHTYKYTHTHAHTHIHRRGSMDFWSRLHCLLFSKYTAHWGALMGLCERRYVPRFRTFCVYF